MTIDEVVQELEWINEGSVIDIRARVALETAITKLKSEPTLDDIEKYCYKRNLSIIDNALYDKYIQPYTVNIRCEDCIWYESHAACKTFCTHPKGLVGWVKPTDFCCRAKRRTVSKEGEN